MDPSRQASGLALSLVAMALTLSTLAHAGPGLVTSSPHLPARDRARLQQTIETHRATNPEHFRAVAAIQGHRPEIYRHFANPVPTVGPELRRLGRLALLPMLEALAFRAPDRRGATDAEWTALSVGMLEAVGVLRDPRSSAVLREAFRRARAPQVQRAAAEALGRLCDDPGLALLRRRATGTSPSSSAAIRGLGQCRRMASARLLASLLAEEARPKRAATLAESLGTMGSSWAWQALGPARADEGRQVREAAVRALVPAFIRHRGPARAAAARALGMVESPSTRAVADQHQGAADASTQAALDRIVRRIEARRQRTR